MCKWHSSLKRNPFVPNFDKETFLEKHFGITFLDLLFLREIGLLAPIDLTFNAMPAEKDAQTILTCGSTCVFVSRPAGTPLLQVNIVAFTDIGRQLLKLVERGPADSQYFEKFTATFQVPGVVERIVEW